MTWNKQTDVDPPPPESIAVTCPCGSVFWAPTTRIVSAWWGREQELRAWVATHQPHFQEDASAQQLRLPLKTVATVWHEEGAGDVTINFPGRPMRERVRERLAACPKPSPPDPPPRYDAIFWRGVQAMEAAAMVFGGWGNVELCGTCGGPKIVDALCRHCAAAEGRVPCPYSLTDQHDLQCQACKGTGFVDELA